MFWLSAALIIIIGAGVLYFWISRTSSSVKESLLYPEVNELKIGDLVRYLGEEYRIDGVLVINEGGFRWRELHLFSDDGSAWLRIESAGALRLTWLGEPEKALVEGEPPANLVKEGITYRLDEQGTAYITRYGNLEGVKSGQNLDYYHYLAEKGNRLSIERIEQGPYLWRFGREITLDEIATEKKQGER